MRRRRSAISGSSSTDDGKGWQEIPAPALPAVEGDEDGSSVSYLLCLGNGGADQLSLIWCGTVPGGLFLSRDRGDSWSLNEPLWKAPERQEWCGGGFDTAGIDSICVDPRDSRHVTLAVSCGGVWVTAGGGASWRISATGMYAENMRQQYGASCRQGKGRLLGHATVTHDRSWP